MGANNPPSLLVVLGRVLRVTGSETEVVATTVAIRSVHPGASARGSEKPGCFSEGVEDEGYRASAVPCAVETTLRDSANFMTSSTEYLTALLDRRTQGRGLPSHLQRLRVCGRRPSMLAASAVPT